MNNPLNLVDLNGLYAAYPDDTGSKYKTVPVTKPVVTVVKPTIVNAKKVNENRYNNRSNNKLYVKPTTRRVEASEEIKKETNEIIDSTFIGGAVGVGNALAKGVSDMGKILAHTYAGLDSIIFGSSYTENIENSPLYTAMEIFQEQVDKQVKIIENKYIVNKDVYNFAKFSGEVGVGIIGLGKFTKGVSAFKGGLQTVFAFKNSAYGYQGATSVVNTSTYIGYISRQVAKVTTAVSLSFSSFKEGKSSCGEVGDENPLIGKIKSKKVEPNDIIFSDKFKKGSFKKQPMKRGWDNEKIANTINNPFKTRKSVNKATNNTATIYYCDEVHGVVVDDVTGKIIQVSNLNDYKWVFRDNYK